MYTVFEEASGKTVRASGDMMTGSAGELRTVLLESLEGDVQAIRLDLSSVRNVDALSLAVLVAFADLVREKYPHVSLEIPAADSGIADLFLLTGLDRAYQFSSQEKGE